MPIMLASALNFSGARCPVCGVGVLPYGKHEPFAVDASGRPFCRLHAAEAEPSYPERFETYKRELRAQRLAAVRVLEDEPAESAAS